MNILKFFNDPYPQSPEQWNDGNYTIYRDINFTEDAEYIVNWD